MKIIKIHTVIIASLLLISCGGGGGGGSSNVRPADSGNVRQFSNSAPVVNVATSKIPAAGTGTKDPYYMEGGGYGGNVIGATDSIYLDGADIFGIKIRGNILGDGSLTVPNPPADIRTAWRNGWTGQGVNVLIADSGEDNHAYIVTMSVDETAPGANYYAVEVLQEQFYLKDGLFDENNNINLPTNTRIDVVNMSFGTDPVANPNTNALRNGYLNSRYNDILQGSFLTNTKDAVLVKAAGNEAANANLVAENLFLATEETTKARILIVGALDKYAQYDNATIANYSNRAGDNEAVSRRFLVEYGGSPFGQDAYLCTEDSTSPADCSFTNFADIDDQGTSYAAPRVSGLAALVRHKFNNLTGAQTAKILLDTATTQGLTCHPNCDTEIYGQGRVDITNALSPIGKLR